MRVWPSIADVSSPRPASETLRPCLISIVSIVRLETVGKTDMKQMYTPVSEQRRPLRQSHYTHSASYHLAATI